MTTQTMLLAALALPACMLHTESRTDTTTIADRVEGMITNLDGADITVTGVRSSGAEVVQTLRWSAVEPAVSVRSINGILYIEARCPPEQLTCSVALDVTVPEAAWLDLSSGQGNITVSRVLSQLVAATGAGDITVQDTDGTIRLEADKGNIDITSVTGDIDLYTGSGDIQGRQLSVGWLTAASDDGDIRIDTSTVPSRLGLFTEDGDVQAQVPAGAYAVDVNTGDGEIDISGITLQNASAQQIDIQTQSGDIRLYGH